LELESKYNSRKRELLETTSNSKRMVKAALDEIRQAITAKERELFKQIDSNLRSNFE
jgi:hypothetical protein